MFNLRDYIMKLLKGSIGNEPDYKVRENALKWYERAVLTTEDLEEIDSLLGETQEETSSVEETEENSEENI